MSSMASGIDAKPSVGWSKSNSSTSAGNPLAVGMISATSVPKAKASACVSIPEDSQMKDLEGKPLVEWGVPPFNKLKFFDALYNRMDLAHSFGERARSFKSGWGDLQVESSGIRTNAEAAACQQAAMETKTAHHGGEKVGPQEELIKPSPIDLGFSLVKPIMDLSLDSAHYESTHKKFQF
nr:hypothetical protein Iba_chr14bCG0520 [Ipomoea batatas]